ncbi:hypothetical protein HanPI659440_Chr11g0425241 [Helianthus annuus]|nr:hypothetical protein HanPI659440_Chr11g0425241 [Helianthus annuus]
MFMCYETIFFERGAHYGDLIANLLLGFTLVWLPLTLAAVLKGFFLRYRFTNLRVTVISGLTGLDKSDFSYKVIKDVQVVPRFIGEWGDVIITLKDGTKVDLTSCLEKLQTIVHRWHLLLLMNWKRLVLPKAFDFEFQSHTLIKTGLTNLELMVDLQPKLLNQSSMCFRSI